MKYFKCGHIMTTHGIKGALKVKNLSDFPRFFKGSRLYIYHNGEYEEVEVLSVLPYKTDMLVTLKGLENINMVLKYHSDDIYVSELDRIDELKEDEFYYTDLIGKTVINEEGKTKGKVIEVRELPQAEYLVVQQENNKTVLIPFIKEFIIEVGETITVHEIEGLF